MPLFPVGASLGRKVVPRLKSRTMSPQQIAHYGIVSKLGEGVVL